MNCRGPNKVVGSQEGGEEEQCAWCVGGVGWGIVG